MGRPVRVTTLPKTFGDIQHGQCMVSDRKMTLVVGDSSGTDSVSKGDLGPGETGVGPPRARTGAHKDASQKSGYLWNYPVCGSVYRRVK